VGLKDGAFFSVEVEGVVFQEGTATWQALTHHPHGADKGGRFPVSFGSETIPFSHEALGSKTHELIHAFEFVEAGGKRFGALIFQETAQTDFLSSGCPDMAVVGTALGSIGGHFVNTGVFVDQGIDFSFRYGIDVRNEFGNGGIVYVVTQTDFGFHLVTVGYSYVVHVVTETDDTHILSIGPTGANAHPNGYLFLGAFVVPVADNHLAGFAQTTGDVTEFAVSVGTLVEVHEVHVHGGPGDLFVVLGVQVQQGLLEVHQPMNPHLGGRERMHPGDDTDALGVTVGGTHDLRYFGRRIRGTFIHDLDGQTT